MSKLLVAKRGTSNGPAKGSSLPSSPITARRGIGEQVADYIRQLIFDGELRDGMHLSSENVANALGVSRVPVREAIVALEREGWVTTTFARGAVVNAFDEGTIRDHYVLFSQVYGLAARRAAQHNDLDIVARLAELAQETRNTDDLIKIGELAYSFHGSVIEAARSPRITVVLRTMSALVSGPFFVLIPRAVHSERTGLRAIVRSIAEGDGEGAARQYAKMLGNQAEMVVDLFHARRAVAPT
jgi:DNA-binding GntR family transcriptional regulator